MRRLLLIAAMAAACGREPAVPQRPAPSPPSRPSALAVSVSPVPGPASLTREDPPYAPDSVFRPETHRSGGPKVPPGALLVREIITGEDAAPFGYFGEAVAIDGDLAVVGAPYADVGWKTDAGAAYVFRRRDGRWTQEAKLAAPGPQPYERFGVSVAVSGGTVVVGADRSDQRGLADSGAAYAYARRAGRWRNTATLLPQALAAHGAIGFSVAVRGTTAAGGAPGADAVFVFTEKDGAWVESATVAAPEPRTGFGHAVALGDDAMVVGAITDSTPLILAGAAHVFRRDAAGWHHEAELQPGEPQQLARFGAAVAIRGDRALVSAPRATVNRSARAGAAWLFEKTEEGWIAAQEITGQPPRSDEELGRALALTSRGAILGSQFSDAAGLGTGRAQLFTFQDGRLVPGQEILARDLAPMNEFAFALAASERDLIIGAPRRGQNANAVGYAYVHRLSP